MRLAFGCIIRGVLLARLIWLVGLQSASVPALFQQDRLAAPDPDLRNEVRAIYSWLITNSTGQDPLYLIAPETYQADYPRDSCLRIPPDHAADFRQIRADFDRRKNTLRVPPDGVLYFTARRVPTSFSTTKPYVI